LFDLVFLVLAFFDSSSLSCHFWPFISSSLQIAPKKFQEFLAADHITTSKQPAQACGKRLATGAIALQRNVVEKAYARAGVDVDLANKL
jgi:hypothetical protein